MANADVFKSMMGGGKGKGATAPAPGSQPTASDISPWTGTEQPVTVQPVLESEPMSEAPASAMPPIPKPGFYRGKGGYEYIVGKQGDITIAKSPRGKAGTVVNMDSVFYDAIAGELAGQTGSAIPTTVSERMKGAAMPAAPKAPAGTVTPMTGEMEAVAYEDEGDKLLGPVAEAGKYGSAAAPKPMAPTFQPNTAMVEAAVKGLGSVGVAPQDAYRMIGDAQKGVNAEQILKSFATLKPSTAPAATAMGPTKEMAKYLGGSNEAAAARTQLEKDAIAGLTAQGKSAQEAQMMVADKMRTFRSTAGEGAPDRAAFDALLQYAGMSAGGPTARPAQVAAR